MQSFDFDEFLLKYRFPLLVLLSGLVLAALGIFYFKNNWGIPETKVEILGNSDTLTAGGQITVEISGAVANPGVYKLFGGSRVEDLLISSGGFSADADRVWTDKYLNRASKLTDGQKVYIPVGDEQSGGVSAKSGTGDQTASSDFSSDSNTFVNINTASLSELDSLPGIGQVYGQNIIEHRPYSNITELVSKGAIKQSLYDKIKDKVSVY